MATSEQRRERIARIAALPEALAAVVNGLGDAELDARAAADPWTVRQVTHHIADSHVNAYIRMKLMLTEAHPTIKPYDQEAWAGLADSALPVDATLSLLRGLHARWIELFEALDESDWRERLEPHRLPPREWRYHARLAAGYLRPARPGAPRPDPAHPPGHCVR
jgi:hypothetical protein